MNRQSQQALELYELIPAHHRLRDAEQGYPLRAALRIIGEQLEILKRDVDGLWDDLFIETCAPWVIPYLGDLVGNNLLQGLDRSRAEDAARALFPDLAGPNLLPEVPAPLRADVAKTIYYRRRKGTPPMLEELARDVTGWAAHVVEGFELLEWTQQLNHLRRRSHECAELRRVEAADRAHGPFDPLGHTVDVRRIAQHEGWHNLRNVAIFLWRLRSYPLDNVRARPVDATDPGEWRFHFSPLGNPAPLFSRWRREGDEAGMAGEMHVPAPIRPAFLHDDLDRYRQLAPPRPATTELYGPGRSISVFRDGVPVGLENPADPQSLQIECRNLENWPTLRPVGRVIAIDAVRGRLAVGDGWADASTEVSYHYGFSADLGGGCYERRKWLLPAGAASHTLRVKSDGTVPPGEAPVTHNTLADALVDWQATADHHTLIRILDSQTYELPATIRLSDGHWLAIEAADGQRPLLQTGPAGLEVQVSPPSGTAADRQGSLTLNGLVVEGFLEVTGDLGRLRLLHSTLVPGRSLSPVDGAAASSEPSLTIEGGAPGAPLNAQLRVEIASSVTGPLRLPEHAEGLWLLDSIVDGRQGTAVAGPGGSPQAGPRAVLERVTVLGTSRFKELALASEVIFAGPVEVTRRQRGCVRFTFVPVGSTTPRRYRCQPDLEAADTIRRAEEAAGGPISAASEQALRAEVQGWLVPGFGARAYGDPAYAQLRLSAPCQLRRGAEDGSEMGAFSQLQQPQREANLRVRLDEYLPFGLDPGLIYVT